MNARTRAVFELGLLCVIAASCGWGDGPDRDLLERASPTGDYVLVGEWEGGQGGGTPILLFEYRGAGEPAVTDASIPQGFDAKWDIRPYENFVPPLDREFRWDGGQHFEGTFDGRACEINVITSSDPDPLLSIDTLCDL